MPDIDIDFADTGRDQIIRYVIDKYGEHNVSQVITFATMGAKAVIRDVGRVLGMDFGEVEPHCQTGAQRTQDLPRQSPRQSPRTRADGRSAGRKGRAHRPRPANSKGSPATPRCMRPRSL